MKQANRKIRLTRRSVVAGLIAGALSECAVGHAASVIGPGLIASTNYGKVRGLMANGVISFRGIPFGGPADGENRFKPAAMPVAWTGIRDATKAGPCAVQNGATAIFGSPLIGNYFSGGRMDAVGITTERRSENCLVLNVLTPALRGKRPVMVYIHGGGFDGLSAALTLISDRFVAEQEVVLVGINHRLNVFGYTYLGGIDSRYADSGNLGQLDLIAALQWVQTNIEGFGGDPANVTLFGESGGGSKISALLAMPAAKGLFHRAIIESGSHFLEARTAEAATQGTEKLLEKLGLRTSQASELQNVAANKLLAAFVAAGGPSGPVVDGRSLLHQTWTPGAPPESTGVSLIIGTCQDETSLFRLQEPRLYSLDWSSLRAQELKEGIPHAIVDDLIKQYRTDYPTDSPSDLYFRISSDRLFRKNAIAQAQAKVSQNAGDVYMYYFAWNTGLDGGRLRAFHTAELPLAMRLVSEPAAETLSKQISGAWASFARTGNPNHNGLPSWGKYSAERRATMVFDAKSSQLVENPARAELALLAASPPCAF
jgi:para-nitrobenzyl esterase